LLESLIDNIFAMFGGRICQQTVLLFLSTLFFIPMIVCLL